MHSLFNDAVKPTEEQSIAQRMTNYKVWWSLCISVIQSNLPHRSFAASILSWYIRLYLGSIHDFMIVILIPTGPL